MRIIGGEAKGRTLVAPAGQKTRPTQDYVRESLFNILRNDVEDAVCLDLFAGTGALSLEAISRGARFAVLVDSDHGAQAAIRKNIAAVRCEDCVKLIPRDYKAALAQLAEQDIRFSLVFLDPPYRMEETGEICDQLARQNMLEKGCRMVVEHRTGKGPVFSGQFEIQSVRHYGDTEITLMRWHGKGAEE